MQTHKLKEHAMQLAVAGWPIAGCPESQLSRLVKQIIDAAKRRVEVLCK